MFRKSQPATELHNAIDTALVRANKFEPNTPEFEKAVDQVVKLHKLKSEEDPRPVSPDTLLSAATSIASIVLIIRHEQFNNITTKALGFVPKMR